MVNQLLGQETSMLSCLFIPDDGIWTDIRLSCKPDILQMKPDILPPPDMLASFLQHFLLFWKILGRISGYLAGYPVCYPENVTGYPAVDRISGTMLGTMPWNRTAWTNFAYATVKLKYSFLHLNNNFEKSWFDCHFLKLYGNLNFFIACPQYFQTSVRISEICLKICYPMYFL